MNGQESKLQSGLNFDFPQLPLPVDQGRFGNEICRFTILFAALLLSIATLPIWMALLAPASIVTINAVVMLSFVGVWFIIMVTAIKNFFLINLLPMVPWDEIFDVRARKFKHVVVLPCCTETSEIIHDCLDTLTFQADPGRLVVVVSFEDSSPNVHQKIAMVRQEYREKFGDLLILVHELVDEEELAGSCSNKNFALREGYRYCSQRHGSGFKVEKYTITVSNTDCKFHPSYFEALEAAYNVKNPHAALPVKMCVWQPPQFFNWGLDQRSFLTRVSFLIKSTFILGANIGLNLHPDGVYSYPIELGYAANFVNPRYVGDDVIAQVRWMCFTRQFVPVHLLSAPVLRNCGANNLRQEMRLWGSDISQSIAATSESFHYFLIHWKLRPFLRGLLWFCVFVIARGFLMCAGPLYIVLAAVPGPWMSGVQYGSIEITDNMNFPLRYLPLAIAGMMLILMIVPFLIDAFLARWLGIVEDINPMLSLCHWLSCPVLVVAHATVAMVSVVVFAIGGKKSLLPRRDPVQDKAAAGLSTMLLAHDDNIQYATLPRIRPGGEDGQLSADGRPGGRPVEKYRNDSVQKVHGKSVTSNRAADSDSRHIYV